jgi:hypothetical protein
MVARITRSPDFTKTADRTAGGFFLPHVDMTVDTIGRHPAAEFTNWYQR